MKCGNVAVVLGLKVPGSPRGAGRGGNLQVHRAESLGAQLVDGGQ
ncbi:hypothetical protein [Streptomyces sp. NPDC001880]